MSSDVTAQHMQLVRELSKPGQPLAKGAPTATKNNPAWWVDGAPTPTRDRLHERLIEEVRNGAPGVRQQRRAIVLAGPPGAGKSEVRKKILGAKDREYLSIDADEFKELLLREAQADGSYEQWIVPPRIRELEAAGERFYPLELAALVHEESSYLAKTLRRDAIGEGDNIVIDTVLSDATDAVALGMQLSEAGYDISVIDVEVPYEVSEQRIRQRWEKKYAEALRGEGDDLGGRWVPSEYAREVFDGEGGQSKPATAARALAEQCPAVRRYQVYWTTAEEAANAQAQGRLAQPRLEVDKTRSEPGAALVDTVPTGAHTQPALQRIDTQRATPQLGRDR